MLVEPPIFTGAALDTSRYVLEQLGIGKELELIAGTGPDIHMRMYVYNISKCLVLHVRSGSRYVLRRAVRERIRLLVQTPFWTQVTTLACPFPVANSVWPSDTSSTSLDFLGKQGP